MSSGSGEAVPSAILASASELTGGESLRADRMFRFSVLQRVEFRNFRSLAKVPLELGKFNVLVGPNNSGKSNIMEAVMFLYNGMAGGGNAAYNFLAQKGDTRKALFYGADAESDEIRVRAAFSEIGRNWEYSCYATVSRGGGEDGAVDKARELARRSQWRYFRFVPAHMRAPQQIAEDYTLADDGSNLSRVLHSLWNKRDKRFVEIESLLRAGVNDVEHLATPIVGGAFTQVAIKEKTFGEPFPATVLSDGTLALLAHLVALSGSPPPGLACFEESENFVHPHIIEHLIDVLKKSPVQILMSTHSPTFLNSVLPEDLIIVAKKDGRTQCSRLKKPEKYRDQALGDLWFTGELGGVP